MLLSEPLPLHELDDVESVCWSLIRRSSAAGVLREDEREDLCAWLIGVAWQASLTYERGDTRYGSRFGRHLAELLPRRIIDYVRRERGRTKWQFSDGRVYERELPQLVSFDAGLDRLDAALATRSSDPATSSSSDLDRFLEGAGREAARDFAEMGLPKP